MGEKTPVVKTPEYLGPEFGGYTPHSEWGEKTAQIQTRVRLETEINRIGQYEQWDIKIKKGVVSLLPEVTVVEMLDDGGIHTLTLDDNLAYEFYIPRHSVLKAEVEITEFPERDLKIAQLVRKTLAENMKTKMKEVIWLIRFRHKKVRIKETDKVRVTIRPNWFIEIREYRGNSTKITLYPPEAYYYTIRYEVYEKDKNSETRQ